MKKFISIIISTILLSASFWVSASSGYITLTPYPYSTHILGEDLVIYGDTDLASLALGFYYPDDEQGYRGMAKYIINISAEELREGYVIPTETVSRLWPEGMWKVVVQNNNARDEIYINMASSASYDRYVRVAEYENSTLTDVTTYNCRGVLFKDNVLTFTTEDDKTVRIFSWNNLTPCDEGNTRIFIAIYEDGYMTSVKSYPGDISEFNTHFTLDISPTKKIKLFYWTDSLSPIQ